MSAELDWANREVEPQRKRAQCDRDCWVVQRGPPLIRVLWSLAAAALLLFGWSDVAYAHSADRPEANEWLMSQTNQNNGMCCDGEDVIALSDSEWRVQGGHYEVLIHGKWTSIEPWMLTQSPENRMSSALLWIWKGRVQCFKPGTFY